MATIKDIAQKLGISDATVSRAFTGNSYVSDELKKKIFEVAKELNYRPNTLAIGLRTRKTNIIALIVPNISNPIYIELVKHIERFSSNDGYSVILCNTDENIEKEKAHLEMLSAGLVDGVILVPCTREKPEEEYINSISLSKIVLFNRNINNCKFDIVKADHYKGVFLAIEHFIQKGYKRIGAIAGNINTSVGRERFKAFNDALRSFGLKVNNELIKYGDFSVGSSFNMTMELLKIENPPEAILIFNNALTKGFIEALKKQKIKVPEDLAVIAIDDIENGNLVEPVLTFVKQPLYEMSKKVYEILIEKINENKKPVRQNIHLFPVELIKRGSC
ncbi:MAG TPA: LacI family transcriptional regulator [Thermoanaerobacterales bacterium]|nr:LacI family transcriptional regulator [Thermoanaerobacterales bacterium]